MLPIFSLDNRWRRKLVRYLGIHVQDCDKLAHGLVILAHSRQTALDRAASNLLECGPN